MILYHFTAREYLPSIARDGLWKGEIPLSATELANAVWLTTDREPTGHGLSDGGELTTTQKIAAGLDPARTYRFADKRAVRFRIILPSSDRRLAHWPRWGRKRLEPSWYDGLTRAGGGKAKAETWWLYLGTIPPERLDEATDLRDGCPLEGWPEAYRELPGQVGMSAPAPVAIGS